MIRHWPTRCPLRLSYRQTGLARESSETREIPTLRTAARTRRRGPTAPIAQAPPPPAPARAQSGPCSEARFGLGWPTPYPHAALSAFSRDEHRVFYACHTACHSGLMVVPASHTHENNEPPFSTGRSSHPVTRGHRARPGRCSPAMVRSVISSPGRRPLARSGASGNLSRTAWLGGVAARGGRIHPQNIAGARKRLPRSHSRPGRGSDAGRTRRRAAAACVGGGGWPT